MQFNRTKGLQTPSGEVSVKSVHGRREGYRRKNLGEGVIHKGRPQKYCKNQLLLPLFAFVRIGPYPPSPSTRMSFMGDPRENSETRMEVLGEEMWTTAAITLSLYACIHQQAVVSRIERRPHLRHIFVNRY